MPYRNIGIRSTIAAAVISFAAIQQIAPLRAQDASSTGAVHHLTGTANDTQGAGFGSGWIDLDPAQDFRAGDRLRILAGGTATRVLVQLLKRGAKPGTSDGIVGAPIDVPASRQIEIPVFDEYKDIVQISVHGGSNPFRIPLGAGNGPATLVSVWLVR